MSALTDSSDDDAQKTTSESAEMNRWISKLISSTKRKRFQKINRLVLNSWDKDWEYALFQASLLDEPEYLSDIKGWLCAEPDNLCMYVLLDNGERINVCRFLRCHGLAIRCSKFGMVCMKAEHCKTEKAGERHAAILAVAKMMQKLGFGLERSVQKWGVFWKEIEKGEIGTGYCAFGKPCELKKRGNCLTFMERIVCKSAYCLTDCSGSRQNNFAGPGLCAKCL